MPGVRGFEVVVDGVVFAQGVLAFAQLELDGTDEDDAEFAHGKTGLAKRSGATAGVEVEDEGGEVVLHVIGEKIVEAGGVPSLGDAKGVAVGTDDEGLGDLVGRAKEVTDIGAEGLAEAGEHGDGGVGFVLFEEGKEAGGASGAFGKVTEGETGGEAEGFEVGTEGREGIIHWGGRLILFNKQNKDIEEEGEAKKKMGTASAA